MHQDPLIERLVALLLTLFAAACAGVHNDPAINTPAPKAPPPARYNLVGYPPSFRAGFDAACDAARRHTGAAPDPARYAADVQYRRGWKDGVSICKLR